MSDFAQCYVNAAQIAAFPNSVADTLKVDILQSSLLAQLLADKAAFTTLSDWHHHYTSALARTQWVRKSYTIHTLMPEEQTVTLSELVDAAAMSPATKASLLYLLRSLRRPANAPALSIFHETIYKPRGSQRPKNLWFELVQVTDASSIQTFALTVETPALAKVFKASADVFDPLPEGSVFKLRCGQFELGPGYDAIRGKVSKALGDKVSQYISPIEHGQDLPDLPDVPEPQDLPEPAQHPTPKTDRA
ncbi:hypothetical protein Q6A49_17095 [Pseudomonas sp. 22-AL-CL-001]|uniref:hypothetical protein n=1 Tax=Pseudomonas alabamensis TaxID=3064349 RepID=UPI0027131679|nr:hypothetical protein [Pseudomonas sp. 22-AL-CL-001]MDO7912252.1 hypothetical protein [Pseudomonas sp. 22-AL-CL-001]